MQKTILVTDATDGIGLEAVKRLSAQGHRVLLHGRNKKKLDDLSRVLSQSTQEPVDYFVADFSSMTEVGVLAEEIKRRYTQLDVLVNNAGVYYTQQEKNQQGIDMRFAVNTFAPYLLTRQLLPLLQQQARVINLSSAAQAEVQLKALSGEMSLAANQAYAQSKLAITMLSYALSFTLPNNQPMILALNPGSLLGSKMVKEAFGIQGGDLAIGANIIVSTALSDQFANTSGLYFDNDRGEFASPHPDALNKEKSLALMALVDNLLKH